MSASLSNITKLVRNAVGIAVIAATCTAHVQAADAPTLTVTRFVVEGDNPLSEATTRRILEPHVGQHASVKSLEAAAIALEKEIRGEGYEFARVIVPAQRPVEGVIRLQVLQFAVNEVKVVGNQNFTEENVLRALPALEVGKPARLNNLSRQLTLANEHPAKRLAINIKESPKPDHIDAEVRVMDVPATQTFTSLVAGTRDADNTLNRNTGYSRLTFGHQRSNLFDRDHAVTLTYTTSPDHIEDVTQLGAFYWLPLYGYDTALRAFWTKSDVNSGTVGIGGQSFNVSGRGEFFGVNATYALPKLGLLSQNLVLGIEQRYFKSDVGFLAAPALTSAVGSQPLSLRYLAKVEQIDSAFGGYAEYVTNTSGGRGNDDASYTAARAGARQNWEAFRYGADVRVGQGAWSFVGRLRGQYANDALIPGEQLGLGGFASVRGLRERETAGDEGYFVNLEAYAPAWSNGIAPFAFYDFGWRRLVRAVPGMPSTDNVATAGLGTRWNWQKRLDVSVTVASVLNGVSLGTAPASKSGDFKAYLTVFYRF